MTEDLSVEKIAARVSDIESTIDFPGHSKEVWADVYIAHVRWLLAEIARKDAEIAASIAQCVARGHAIQGLSSVLTDKRKEIFELTRLFGDDLCEIERLKRELAAKDAEIARLHNENHILRMSDQPMRSALEDIKYIEGEPRSRAMALAAFGLPDARKEKS